MGVPNFGARRYGSDVSIETSYESLENRCHSCSIDTVIHLKAGQRQLLMRTGTFEPATLRVLLFPAYYRIGHTGRRGVGPSR